LTFSLSLRLRDNQDPLEGVPEREDHPDVAVFLEVSSSSPDRADELQVLIGGTLGGERLQVGSIGANPH